MQPQQPRLAIDYGTASTQAVLAWPDGRWLPLPFDGALELSSAVHTDPRAGVLVGAAAWRHAQSSPDGLVAAPLRAGTGSLHVAGSDVEVADLVAATLRQVGDIAAQNAGGQVVDVRMVVPAGWGPVRRTWLRHAAYQAGLGQPRLLEAPVAAADRLLGVGVQVPVGALLLIVDVGAGTEATVLRRGPTGFEVLSTIDDPAAGGTRVDDLLTAALTAGGALPAGLGPTAVTAVRAAKEALSRQAVVTMSLPPPTPAVVVTGALLHDAAQPVYKRVGELAAAAVANAELTPDRLVGVYCVGSAGELPGVVQAVGDALGVPAQLLTQPGFAAVLGSAEAGGVGAEPVAPPPPARLPALRRLSGIAASGLASLLVYAQFVFTATFANGTPDNHGRYYYVLATWGELTMAAVFALLTCLQAGSFFAAAVRYNRQQQPHPPGTGTAGTGGAAPSVAAGIAVAAGAGVAVAALYAVIAAVSFGIAVNGPLRWALLPILPIALTAAATSGVAARRRITPPVGWDAYLAFPLTSTVTAAAGTALVAIWWAGGAPAALTALADALARLGGLLIGVAVACALVRPLMLRVLVGVPLGLFGLVVIGPGATGILAVVYAVAATCWWAQRAWTLTRTPARADHAH